ncbi:Hemolysin [Granulibacter bethesdensis CGDNIH4]|nr:Hemolysin [Granulibacter bethesdensis CGDNIH4]
MQFGVDLTPEQVAALDDDIVWYVPRTVNGKTVLVPQLYQLLQQIPNSSFGVPKNL